MLRAASHVGKCFSRDPMDHIAVPQVFLYED